VEAAGQLFHLFRDGLDYAFIRPEAPERGVLFGSNDPNPSTGPSTDVGLPMSLYRAKEVGLPAPLGVATSLVPSDTGFTD
jgi:hypothetical protein